MICPRCGSADVNVQAVSIVRNRPHGMFYWLFFGWLIDLLLWIFWTIPRLLIALFFPRRTTTRIRSVAVCQFFSSEMLSAAPATTVMAANASADQSSAEIRIAPRCFLQATSLCQHNLEDSM